MIIGLGRACLLAAALSLAMATTVMAEGQTCLTDLERQVARDHVSVEQLLPHQVSELLRNRDAVVLLDVREAAEFEVSHIPGAIWVDPDIAAEDLIARLGEALPGRTVLLYCSVGVRSSRLAGRVAAAALQRGAAGVYNIRGGIFAWHNYGKGLNAATERTELVHPYSRAWSRYLDFPNYTTYRRPR